MGSVRLDPDDELSELIPLDQAPTIAQVSARTLRRWIAAGRLTVTADHVVERELLAVEAERWASRHAGRPGARPPKLAC
jgi:predicted site-specific integrase-resolvase